MSSMSKRFSVYRDDDVYQLSAVLDPRFKLRWSKSPADLEDKLLKYARRQDSTCENSSDDGSPPRKLSKIEDGLFSFMTPTKHGKKRHISGDGIKMEVSEYLLEPCDYTNPLQCWKENADRFPILAKLAKLYLNVPATSAPVERLFSIAGKIFRPDRCRLSDSTFQMLMMIKCNEKVSNEYMY
jgi:hypothetical protein